MSPIETARSSQDTLSGEVFLNGSNGRTVHPFIFGTGIEVVGEGKIERGGLTEEVVYLRGHHPHLGRRHEGLTGEETVVGVSLKIKPRRLFFVHENGHLPEDPQA